VSWFAKPAISSMDALCCSLDAAISSTAATKFSVPCEISASPVGDTRLTGEVLYCAANGWVWTVFDDSVSISTGNAVAAVSVRFKAFPYGTAVEGSVCS